MSSPELPVEVYEGIITAEQFAALAPGEVYYVIYDDDAAKVGCCRRCTTVNELVATLREVFYPSDGRLPTLSRVYVFQGRRLSITAGPLRHLVLPNNVTLSITPQLDLTPDETLSGV